MDPGSLASAADTPRQRLAPPPGEAALTGFFRLHIPVFFWNPNPSGSCPPHFGVERQPHTPRCPALLWRGAHLNQHTLSHPRVPSSLPRGTAGEAARSLFQAPDFRGAALWSVSFPTNSSNIGHALSWARCEVLETHMAFGSPHPALTEARVVASPPPFSARGPLRRGRAPQGHRMAKSWGTDSAGAATCVFPGPG